MRRAVARIAIVGGMLLSVVGCPSKNPPNPENGRGAAAIPDARPLSPPAGYGTVTGKVTFTGTAPEPDRVNMSTNAACAALNPGGAVEEPWVASGNVRAAFVHVKEGLAGRAFDRPSDKVVLDQRGCRYRPRVIGVRVGQPLEILNSDPTNHNVNKVAGENESWNIAMRWNGDKDTKVFKRPEVMAKMRCDIHPWMGAYIGIVDHPHFAVTSTDGAFAFKDLPAGDYVIEAWHEKFGTRIEKVTVAIKGQHNVELKFAQ